MSFGSRRFAALLPLATLLVAVSAAAVAAGTPEWNIARIGGPATAPGVVVAVVDTGVDASHPALAGRVLPPIVIVDDGASGDPHGHGTHVAGIVAGADAGCGGIGVVPDATILPVRVLDRDGAGTLDDVEAGIRAAADAGAAVINLSLGADVEFRALGNGNLRQAVEYAWSKGSIPVLAAGNDALLGSFLGSGYGDIPAVVVTATDFSDQRPAYATSTGNAVGGARWGIAAPGGDDPGDSDPHAVVSAYPGNRCAGMVGTSMAAPHVSGALAALRAAGYSPRAAVDRVLATARDLGDRSSFGAGLLDLRAALAGSGTPEPTVSPTTGPAPSSSVAPATTAAPSTTPTTTLVTPEVTTTGAVDVEPVPAETSTTGASNDTADPQIDESAATSVVDAADESGRSTVPVLVAGLAAAGVAVAAVTLSRRTRRG